MAIRLSNRLSALASLVSKGHRLADIGTDHGYIPIYLCQTGIIPSAIAMDIGKGPAAAGNSPYQTAGTLKPDQDASVGWTDCAAAGRGRYDTDRRYGWWSGDEDIIPGHTCTDRQ